MDLDRAATGRVAGALEIPLVVLLGPGEGRRWSDLGHDRPDVFTSRRAWQPRLTSALRGLRRVKRVESRLMIAVNVHRWPVRGRVTGLPDARVAVRARDAAGPMLVALDG